MVNRKTIRFERWRLVRAFAVLTFTAGIAATSLGTTTALANPCTAVDVVVARGTAEPGWLGAAIGDPLYNALQHALPVASTAYSVNYPANLGVPSSVSDGTRDLTAHLEHQAARCPDQRFVLVGYSQGAIVVHGVLGTGNVTSVGGIHTLPGWIEPRVAAVLLFGDPNRLTGWGVPGTYSWRTGNYCTAGDPVCGAGFDWGAHADYGWAMWPAAGLAASRV
ncbi:cutinase family protein [Nocardia sp. NPDC051832]|uniref:cutinase family protein n=1 Tax=Nocardia sp. NPDC051832 TaxID=3155673 RepID=UPI0034395310